MKELKSVTLGVADRFTPTTLKQAILATVKPVFYSGGPYAGRVITVEGEIVNEPANYGQSLYFNIRDIAGCTLNVRTFRSAFSFDLTHTKGTKVEIKGIIDLQEKQNNNADWDILFKATKVDLIGVGEYAQAERSLIQELEELGYFNNKQPLPSFSKIERCRIGIITSSSTGANAFEDIKQTLAALPFFELQIFGVSLYSPESIAKAIALADETGRDILIVTRGGGERLEVFNERPILDAVFNAKTVVISAVGHAKDRMLIDRVADLSAATPTEAAKILSDHYIGVLAQRENERLKQVLNQMSKQNAGLSESINQLNKSIRDLHKEQQEKDLALKDLALTLDHSRKANRNLLMSIVGIIIIFGLALKFLH